MEEIEFPSLSKGKIEPSIMSTCIDDLSHSAFYLQYSVYPSKFEGKAVGSLVVRAPYSGLEGLGSMPVPPNTLQVHTEYMLVKSGGPKDLWAESRVQGTGENFPPLQFHA
ncbi:uncharacterized protein TNCV_2099951 [Trichonephila clavipes]|nr:uncharacterized protein TNCV_2099951 [Trichonephila clavipes]